jgi:hypothetical protein
METIALTAGLGKPVPNGGNGNGHRHHPYEHKRNGVCLAALRAFTAAQLYLAPENTFGLAECALRCGSGVAYVRAAIVLLEHADLALIDAVVYGRINILVAAKPIAAETKLIAAFTAASPKARAAAGAKLGPGVIWDTMVVPTI